MKQTSRISKAATGKILSGIITTAKETGMDAETFRTLMYAAATYMESASAGTDNLPEEWDDIKDTIDKAAARSAKARERAAKRRVAKSKWSPARTHIPAGSLKGFRDSVRRAAKRSGKETGFLDRLKSPCDMTDILSATPRLPFVISSGCPVPIPPVR